jgi:hypothetical protein
MEAQIKARILELEAERDHLLTEANKKIFAYQVAIAELRKLLPPDAPIPAGSVAEPGEEQAVGSGRDDEAEIVHQDDVARLGL